ncbi:MAG: hypothetical protein AAFP81_00765 [Pseudomonadota bacterium]
MRRSDWQQKLSQEAIRLQNTPYEFGEHDCILFAANCVLAMTGRDLADDIRGRYKTEIGAARIIKNEGFSSLGDMIADRLPEIELREVGRGDVVLCDGPYGEFAAMVVGKTCVSPGRNGMIHIPVSQAKRGYRVT